MNLICTAETKFLGVYITEKLKWNTHVQSLANKLSKVPFMIKSLNEIMSPFMTCNIDFLKFQSLLRIGILFLGVEDNSNKIFRIQKRVIRSMIGVNSRTSCKQLFKEIKILTLASLSLSLHTYIHTYTECPRRNVKYFGSVFLMLNYTDITQNTYIQS